ncbi:hypothetical protein CXG50_09960 [Pseudomonas plecoglossicida]|nr:hypothetical protein CX682_31200 [Pseudomonas sp. FFUP_PS_41]PLU98020.1 hypothetical protein CXG52_12785 [Pseudomonas plecoglossicida]PLV09589.1 hypothetical protein CXG50_09960 [Pseudomonas plecoglossicida]
MATPTNTRRSSRPINRCSSTRTRSIRGRCCVFLTDLCSLYRPYRRQASSHRITTGLRACEVHVGAGLPAKGPSQAYQ